MAMIEPPGRILFKMQFPAQSDKLRLVRSVVREAAQLCGCSEDCSEGIVIAVNEACMNVIQHAYQRDPSGEMILEIWRNDDDLIFRLVDFAAPVDIAEIRPRDLDELRPGGLGTHFIHEMMDETAFLAPPDGAGNLLQMVKRIS